jgi:hypothetical protein
MGYGFERRINMTTMALVARARLVLGGLAMLVALALLGYQLWQLPGLLAIPETSQWVSVPATITFVYSYGSTGRYVYQVEYSYVVDGQTYTGEQTTRTNRRDAYNGGETTTIIYNPQHPSESRLFQTAFWLQWGQWGTGWLAVVVAFGGGAWLLWTADDLAEKTEQIGGDV